MPGVPTIALAFDEVSGDVVDHSSNGHNFPLTGATTRTPAGGGAFGTRGLTQLGAEAFVASSVDPTTIRTPQWTWMLNLKTSAEFTGWVGEFYRGGTDDTGVTGLLYLFGTLRFRVKDTSGTPYEITIPVSHGSFRNICATYDGTTLRAYVDGVLVNSVSLPNFWTATALRLLDGSDSTTVIDDFRMFNGALTQEEIDAWRVLPADQVPTFGTPGRLKYESSPGVWTSIPLKTETGDPLVVKSETSPGTWEALP
jgi:hypothetical protein